MLFFLIGFMGSGKTLLGKEAAEKADIPFCDMDRLIEKSEKKSLPEIFAENGETYFRQLEFDFLRQIPINETVLIATGGGVPCHTNNMDYMNSIGKTIYINLTPEQLQVRLEATDIASRPLLKGKRQKELFDFITSKLAEREPFYKQADYIITGEDDELTEQIIQIIKASAI